MGSNYAHGHHSRSIDSIGKAIRATFGTAIENAFESRLGFVE